MSNIEKIIKFAKEELKRYPKLQEPVKSNAEGRSRNIRICLESIISQAEIADRCQKYADKLVEE